MKFSRISYIKWQKHLTSTHTPPLSQFPASSYLPSSELFSVATSRNKSSIWTNTFIIVNNVFVGIKQNAINSVIKYYKNKINNNNNKKPNTIKKITIFFYFVYIFKKKKKKLYKAFRWFYISVTIKDTGWPIKKLKFGFAIKKKKRLIQMSTTTHLAVARPFDQFNFWE